MPPTAHLGPSPTPERMREVVARAAEVLEAGGAVVLPTDTVYGLAALPTVAGATARLFDLKARSEGQPLAVLVADVDQALDLVDGSALTPEVERWMRELWPGALTLVLTRSGNARHLDLGGSPATIGVRCPDHAFIRALTLRTGPLATTSANRHGQPTPSTAVEAARSLEGEVGLVVDGGPAGSVASTVVDATSRPWRLLRQGGVPEEDLRR